MSGKILQVKVVSKVSIPCKCVQSVNFNTYYDKCDKCNGSGKLTFNGNEVVCNRCYGKKKIVKNICPLCNGEGNVIKKGNVDVKLHKGLKEGDIVIGLSGSGNSKNVLNAIEYAKKSMETMKWCSKDCLISFRKGIKEMDSYIKKTPLPWYLEEYYDYAKEEVKNFINDIKILNSKNSYYSGKIYGNP